MKYVLALLLVALPASAQVAPFVFVPGPGTPLAPDTIAFISKAELAFLTGQSTYRAWEHTVANGSTTGTNKGMFISVAYYYNDNVRSDSVKYGTQSASLVAAVAANNLAEEWWYAPSPATGTDSIRVWFGSTYKAETIGASLLYKGVKQTGVEAKADSIRSSANASSDYYTVTHDTTEGLILSGVAITQTGLTPVIDETDGGQQTKRVAIIPGGGDQNGLGIGDAAGGTKDIHWFFDKNVRYVDACLFINRAYK